MAIPKLLHKIFLNDTADRLPSEIVEQAIASWQRAYPDHSLYVWDAPRGERLILQHFGTHALELYRSIRPLAFRADFLRLCVLLVHGGIYSDLKQRLVRPLPLEEEHEMLLVLDRNVSFTDVRPMQNCLLACAPGNACVRAYFDRVCENLRTQAYGSSALDITGPECFTKALSDVQADMEVCLLYFRLVSGRFVIIDGNGDVVVEHKYDGTGSGDWSAFGEPPYYVHWMRKAVYGARARAQYLPPPLEGVARESSAEPVRT